MSIDKYNTFWNIIKDNRIEIPTIQRDYTYGRRSAAIIRRKMVSDIVTCLKEKQAYNLDFVYGKLFGKENQLLQETNKSNIQALLKTLKSYASELYLDIPGEVVAKDTKLSSNITFIPLDGQQRLTTLYLIHWYIIQLNTDIDSLNILKRFSYSTRISSREFCKMLSDKLFSFNINTGSVSEIICNSEEYFSTWRKDPTVNSMLIVIDEIHAIFRSGEMNIAECWKQLAQYETITFDFFDLDNFDLTDDLYVKMNARGRQLTSFEIFKAWLIKEHSEIISVEQWKKKLDIKWYDYFWKAKDKASYSVDSEFMQFFKIMFLGDYMKLQNPEEAGMNDDSDLGTYDSEIPNTTDFKSIVAVLRKKDARPLEIFKEDIIFKDKIDDYLGLLEYLNFDINSNTKILTGKYVEEPLSKLIFGEKLNNLTWWDTTLHYGVTRYLLHVGTNTSFFNQWVRIISNLIYNTKIDTPKLFIDAIYSIDKLIERVATQNVYLTLSSLKEEDITFFSPTQKKEEILKSFIIINNKNDNWEQSFIEAENHTYFYGQIGFIFNLVSGSPSIDSFSAEYKKVAALFSEEVLNDHSYLLQRALLAISNCFYKERDNRLFNSNVRGTLRNRAENWRKLLENNISAIKSLIEHESFKENDIVKSLNQIIKIEHPGIKDTYYGKFVGNPKLFDYAAKNTIRRYEHNYYILKSTRMFGYYVELYTYDWYLRNEKGNKAIPEYKISYEQVKGTDNEPGVILSKGRTKKYLFRNHKTAKYYFYNSKPRLEYETITKAINALKNLN